MFVSKFFLESFYDLSTLRSSLRWCLFWSLKSSFEVDDVVREIKKTRLKASKDLVQILRKQFGLDEYFE